MMRRCSVVLIDSVYISRIAFFHRRNFIQTVHRNCLGSTSQSAIRYNDVKKSDLLDQNKCLYSTDPENGTKPAEGKDVISSNESNLPTKELLFQIDWLFEVLVPGFMKTRLRPFLDITSDDVIFEDRIFNYNFVGKSRLNSHIAKVRAYYRYLSPYNKIERLGSCIYEGEDVIIIVWRLSSLRTNLMSYLPKLLTSRQDEMNVVEGALDVHVTKDGRIYKIINRKITASDLEGAKVMAEIKKEANEKRLRAEKQKWVNQLGSLTDDRANH